MSTNSSNNSPAMDSPAPLLNRSEAWPEYEVEFNQIRRDYSLSRNKYQLTFPMTLEEQMRVSREETNYKKVKLDKISKLDKIPGKPFSLAKFAYMRCSEVQKKEYEEKLTPFIEVKECCFLMNNPLEMMESAIDNHHLNCFKLGHRNALNVPRWSGYRALALGYIDILEYAVENGCDFILEIACESAAINGNVSCLEYVHKMGGELTSDIMNKVVAYGNVECLKYLLQHKCKWSDNMCALSSVSGDLTFVEYCRLNGCPWTVDNSSHWATLTANFAFLEMEKREGYIDLMKAMKKCVKYIERTANVRNEYKLENYFGVRLLGLII